MKKAAERTSVNISKPSHALISLVAHTRRVTVGAALEAAITAYAGDPAKLAKEAVAMTVSPLPVGGKRTGRKVA